MQKLLSIICLITIVNTVKSQSVNIATTNTSLINQLCPEFVFDTLLNAQKEKLALSDFKGKFVIVNFWGTFCVPCINDIPKIEQFQKRYGDTLQILMVAVDGLERAKQFYETRKKGNKPMTLSCAINRNFVKYFQVKEVSTYVWIDEQGYIKGITDDSQMTARNVADFVNRKPMHIRQLDTDKRVYKDYKKYLLPVANEIDSSSVMYSSTCTKYLQGFNSTYTILARGRTKVSVTNMAIQNLYQVAFGDTSGAFKYNRTVLECAHPEKMTPPKGADFGIWKLDNTYCYELKVPAEKQASIYKIMQDDLKRIFGYQAFQEYRTQKCWVLKAEKNINFYADSNLAPKMALSTAGVTLKNQPFAQLVDLIQYYNQTKIILDETGITGKIDVVLQAEMNDIDSLNRELKKIGLSLHYEDRQVLLLIIKDPQ